MKEQMQHEIGKELPILKNLLEKLNLYKAKLQRIGIMPYYVLNVKTNRMNIGKECGLNTIQWFYEGKRNETIS